MATININRREVVKKNRNGRAIEAKNIINPYSTQGTNTIDWAEVTPDLVSINRDLHVTGNITASEDVIAYVADAVTSDVLDALTVSAPLAKEGTNIQLKVNPGQLEVNGNNELQIKSGVLTPAIHSHIISDVTGLQTALDGKLSTSLKGSVNGLAELDANGFVKNAQLPSYVDDVLEYGSFALLPATGETGKIYITTDDNKTYRWSGSVYAQISSSLALGVTSATAFRGDLGNTAYQHSQITHDKNLVGLSNVDNTSDSSKSVLYAANSGLLNNLSSNVFVKNNSTNTGDLLGLYTITKSIQLTTNWQNTGILNTDLSSGLYLLTCSCNDYPVGGNYSQTYTGQLYWYATATNDSESDEIILHSSGHAKNNLTIYLRTKRNGQGVQTFEIAANYAATGVNNYTFNFRRLI